MPRRSVRKTRRMRKSRRTEVLQLLGLAQRAGAVVPGTGAVQRTLRMGEARLILMAEDASSVQMEKILKILRTRPIPQARLGDRATLGAAVGRGPVSAVAVTGESFADELRRRLDGGTIDVAPGEAEE